MTNIGMLPLLPVYHMAVALPSRALAYWDRVKSLFNRTSEVILDMDLPMLSKHKYNYKIKPLLFH